MSIHSILIVDDSATERHAIGEILKKNGFSVMFADSGEHGLESARTCRPDLILLDIIMPGMNGYQAMREISEDEVLSKIPVLICSTKSQLSDKAWGLRLGAKEYITKPIDADELIQKIEEIFA